MKFVSPLYLRFSSFSFSFFIFHFSFSFLFLFHFLFIFFLKVFFDSCLRARERNKYLSPNQRLSNRTLHSSPNRPRSMDKRRRSVQHHKGCRGRLELLCPQLGC